VPWYWLIDFVDQSGGMEKELAEENLRRWITVVGKASGMEE